MNLKSYSYQSNESYLDYEFESKGPKGIIKKVVRLMLLDGYDNVYNLGFGDLDEKTGEISDTAISNNNDTEKILATVAQIAYQFTGKYSKASIFIQGTTAARTRLYQKNIGKYWEEIDKLFEVYGLRKGEWEPFQKDQNYDAFLAKRRKGAFLMWQIQH